MDDLINDMKRKGLVSFVSAGKAQAVFDLLNLMATTEPIETDPDWWELHLIFTADRPYPFVPCDTIPITTDELDWACRLTLIRN